MQHRPNLEDMADWKDFESDDRDSEYKKKKKCMKLLLVEGPEGLSVYLTTTRIAGPKPWGGGKVIKEWEVSAIEIQKIIDEEEQQMP